MTRLCPWLILAAAAAIAAAPPGFAQTCTARQMSVPATAGQQANNPAVDAVGEQVAFASNDNYTGGNPDGSADIYLYTASLEYLQFLVGVVSPNSCEAPQISSDGLFLAFSCSGDPEGTNPDLSQEVYLHDIANNVTTQVTFTSGIQNDVVAIDSMGSRIAFSSQADFTGGNGDGNHELFIYNVAGNSFRQVTSCASSPSTTIPASFDATGNLLAYDFDCGLVDNADGEDEVFLYNYTLDSSLRLTNDAGDSGAAHISADGAWLTFSSDGDLLGTNPDLSFEVFLVDLGSLVTTQVTNSTGGTQAFGFGISADGGRVLFQTEAVLSSGDTNGQDDLHIWHRLSGNISRVTDQIAGPAFNADLSDDGNTVVFVTTDDLTGDNPSGNLQAFISDISTCATGAPSALEIPTASQTGLIVLGLVLSLLSVGLLRRRAGGHQH